MTVCSYVHDGKNKNTKYWIIAPEKVGFDSLKVVSRLLGCQAVYHGKRVPVFREHFASILKADNGSGRYLRNVGVLLSKYAAHPARKKNSCKTGI